MSQQPTLIPVKDKPGVFLNRTTGKYIHIMEWREDDKYDTVFVNRGPIAPGTTLHFFRDLAGKNLIDTNFSSPRRLPAGEEMILDRIGVQIPLAFGNLMTAPGDIKKIAENGYLAFKINRKDVAEGPLIRFPSGYGLAGMTNSEDDGILSIGVPSTAAAAKLLREQNITSDRDVDASVAFFDRDWARLDKNVIELERGVAIRISLHGLIKSAATK